MYQKAAPEIYDLFEEAIALYAKTIPPIFNAVVWSLWDRAACELTTYFNIPACHAHHTFDLTGVYVVVVSWRRSKIAGCDEQVPTGHFPFCLAKMFSGANPIYQSQSCLHRATTG